MRSLDKFVDKYQAKYLKVGLVFNQLPEGVAVIFYSFPAELWDSIRTTHPIESTFATIRYRTRQVRECVTREDLLQLALCAKRIETD